jgi:hypothetical protein
MRPDRKTDRFNLLEILEAKVIPVSYSIRGPAAIVAISAFGDSCLDDNDPPPEPEPPPPPYPGDDPPIDYPILPPVVGPGGPGS